MAQETAYTGYGVIPINTILVGPTEVGKRKGFSLQVVSIGTTGVVTVETSNDGVNWVGLRVVNANTGAIATAITAAGAYVGACIMKFIRVRLSTATTAGTTTLACAIVDQSTTSALAPVANPTQPVSLASLPALAAGSAIIGLVYNTVSATAANGPTLLAHKLPTCAATTNATSVKNAAGRLLKIRAHNASAALRYLKLYNKASAPTVGTDVPVLTFALKIGDQFMEELTDYGFLFSTGIAYAITSGAADNDTGVCVAGDVVGLSMIYI